VFSGVTLGSMNPGSFDYEMKRRVLIEDGVTGGKEATN
jgi:hypothetical protein